MRNQRHTTSAALGVALTAVFLIGLAYPAVGAPTKHADNDGSRTPVVHDIPLLNEWGQEVRPDDERATPFSTRNTCGDCHDYDKIRMGWHFNAASGNSLPGRPGEPWVLTDEATGTQLPLSYRGWDGTWNPESLGMTYWDFLTKFGWHMPGGDIGEAEEDEPDLDARWDISGHLDINCLACHNASRDQNQSEWAFQIARQNFRWAATGSSGLGVVQGVASRLPNYWDVIDGPNPDDDTYAVPPYVEYDAHNFDTNDHVFFDVVRKPPAERCYFCHSSFPADQSVPDMWQSDGDVHLHTGGFTCADCHRNGLDHFISRGDECDAARPEMASLSCEGCHLGNDESDSLLLSGGRLGAPVPEHKGLAPVHLEKLTCTACHAGPMPKGDEAGLMKTSRANRLGVHGKAQWDKDLPYIVGPVYKRQEDGKIGPYYMMWPAFWGAIANDEVTPIDAETVQPFIGFLEENASYTELEAKMKALVEESTPLEVTYNVELAREAATEVMAGAAEKHAAAVQEKTAKTVAYLAASNAGLAGALGEFEAAFDEYKAEAAAAAAEAAAAEKAAEEGAQPAEEAPAEDAADTAEAAAPEHGEGEPAPEATEAVEEAPRLNEEQIAAVLAELTAQGAVGDKTPVYVAGGKLYRLGDGGKLVGASHKVAEAYSWPMAHDVRPAGQSLGAKDCSECHSENSPFFFAKVEAQAPSDPTKTPVTVSMYEFQELEPSLLETIEEGLKYRYVYLALEIGAAVLVAFALVRYGFLALEAVARGLFVAVARKKS